jgi:hypothetical protein
VGKTTVATALAHDPEVALVYPDGVLWTSVGQTPDLLSGLAHWGLALGTDELLRLKTVQDAKERLAAILRERRMLLIVDDIWEVQHATAFMVGGRYCATLITTRLAIAAQDLAGPAGDVYKLDVLKDQEALRLLEQIAPSVVKKHLRECRELVRELEGLPLALQVAGRLLNVEASRGWNVSDLLGELHEERTRILEGPAPADMGDFVNQTTPTVAALLRKSTDRLDAQTRERFAYLGVFAPKPATFDPEAMAAVWKVEMPQTKQTADELVARGLLEPVERSGSVRFHMHALLVSLAKSLCTE